MYGADSLKYLLHLTLYESWAGTRGDQRWNGWVFSCYSLIQKILRIERFEWAAEKFIPSLIPPIFLGTCALDSGWINLTEDRGTLHISKTYMFNELTLRLFTQSEPMVKEYAAECLSKLNIGGKKNLLSLKLYRLTDCREDTRTQRSHLVLSCHVCRLPDQLTCSYTNITSPARWLQPDSVISKWSTHSWPMNNRSFKASG